MAVTKRKLSYYNVKTIEELKNIPNSYFPAIQAGIDNYKVPANSFFNTFPTKNDVYNTFPTKTEMYNAISQLGGNSIVWIYNNGHAYTDTIDALNSKKLPIYVYDSTPGRSGTSAVPAGLAYVKNVKNSGVSFYSLIDTNAEFTEYFVKTDNTVETTEYKNVDACIIVEHNDPEIHTKITDALSYGQAVICKSANKYMNLAKTENETYSFRYDSNDSHGYWNITGNDYTRDWSYIEDSTIINETVEDTIDTSVTTKDISFDTPLNFAYGTITVRTINDAAGYPTIDILNDTTVIKTFEGTVHAGISNNVIPVIGNVTGIRITYNTFITNGSPIKVTAEGIGNGPSETILDNQVLYEDQPIEFDNQPIIFDT